MRRLAAAASQLLWLKQKMSQLLKQQPWRKRSQQPQWRQLMMADQ
jgi:hypothetical protein